MKYLKRFNESNQYQYQKISWNEMNSLRNWDDIRKYSDKIVNYLKPKADYLNHKIVPLAIKGNTYNFLNIRIVLIGSQIELIIGVDEDEWFYVELNEITLETEESVEYKCDQLEGLFQLLENNI